MKRLVQSVCLLLVTAAHGFQISDEQFYQLPRLFELDDFEQCSASRGAYCMGSFSLSDHQNPSLMKVLKGYSSDKYHYNHSQIHRGVCVSARCAHLRSPVGDTSLKNWFSHCVANATKEEFGLDATLTSLDYCRTPSRPAIRPIDALDISFANVVGLLLLINLIGTVYDAMRNQDGKPNKYLQPWSLVANWGRLTADHADPRRTALKPVQGMKSITLLLVMLAHSVLAYHLTYIQNPLFIEKAGHHVLAAYFQNGTSIVQSFVLASSFLLGYNLLLWAEDHPDQKLGLWMLPKCLVHRLLRIVPVYMFVVGLASSWWEMVGDGPLWAPLVAAESRRCRAKWWTHALFINNLVMPDEKCLIHTWFLAVDMQLYIVSAVLTLTLANRRRAAPVVMAALLLLSIAGNFAGVYYFHLKPISKLMFPEYLRIQYKGVASFTWLYAAPWDSLPAALLGTLAAFVYHQFQTQGFKADQHTWMRLLYRVSVPCMFLWVLLGCWWRDLEAPLPTAALAALDRPVFTAMVTIAMLGFFNQIDKVWWKLLSWRGWEVLGRMSLSIYLVHWLVAVTQLAWRAHLSPASVHEIGGHWLWTVMVSYAAAVPLHLLVELPVQKFLQAVLS